MANARRTASTCYICAGPIEKGEGNREHVVPKELFNSVDRCNLITLPAHKECNRSYQKDDDYFRLCVTAAAYKDPSARKLWSGPVMRGFHRLQSLGLKKAVLLNLVPMKIQTEGGPYLGRYDVMLQDAGRILRVVNRIVRGLYTELTGKILPAGWPIQSDLIDRSQVEGLIAEGKVDFCNVGRGTLQYTWEHLEDDREGIMWLVFYRLVHFWGYTGTRVRFPSQWQYRADGVQ